MVTWSRRLGTGTVFAIACGAFGCNELWDITKRELDPHLICSDAGCACAEGFSDCDDNPDNGCEADLHKATSCGACGHVCSNGQCMAGDCACLDGFDDCDGDPGNGCEATLLSDPMNCGRCGRDCLGAACEQRSCRPIVLAETDLSYAFEAGPLLRNGYVYFGGCASQMFLRVSVDGGVAEAVLQEPTCVQDFGIDEDHVYWLGGSTVFVAPLDGQSPSVPLVAGQSWPGSLRVVDGRMYWTQGVPGWGLFRAAASPGEPMEQLWQSDGMSWIEAVTVNETHCYFATQDGIFGLAHDRGSPAQIALAKAKRLALDGSHLYWTVQNAPDIWRVPLGGGETQLVASGTDPGPLASDGVFVYWFDFGLGVIQSTPVDGRGDTVQVLNNVPASLRAITVDEDAVYWLTDRQVMKVAK
jgi:hypothetical protein